MFVEKVVTNRLKSGHKQEYCDTLIYPMIHHSHFNLTNTYSTSFFIIVLE